MNGGSGAGHRIARTFLSLGAGEAAARLVAFAGTVYLARTLGPAMYGIIGVAMGVMLYFTQIADAGIELVGVPAIARAKERAAEVAAPVLTVRLLFACGLVLVVWAVGLTVLPQPDGSLLAVFALALLPTALSTRWVHLGLERTDAIAIGRLIGEVLALALILAFVRSTAGIAIVPLAQFVGVALTSFVLLVALRRSGIVVPVRFDWPAARPLYERSRHLLVFTLLGLLLFNFDLILLRYVKGASDAGYYAAAYTLISFAANLIVAYAHTVLPVLARLEHEPIERNGLFQSAMSQAFAAALPLAVGGHLIAPQLIGEVFGGGFGSSVVALQWLIWSIPLAALRELPVVGLIAAHREQDLLRVNAITAACNIALCIVVIPMYGLPGAAAATVATEVIRLALALGYARRAGLTAPAPQRFLRPVLASAAMAATLVLLPQMRFELAVPIGGAAYAAGLLLTGGIELRRGILPRLRV